MIEELFLGWSKSFPFWVNRLRYEKGREGEKALLFLDGHSSR